MIITITGGTGSFGSALAKHLLATTEHKLRLLGRSESKLLDLQRELFPSSRITYILADIRDEDKLHRAFRGTDFVFHAAALKQVPLSYIHTSEFVKTNIIGTRNVALAAMDCGVDRVLFISSDKACAPFNPYGVSKAMGEAIMTEANLHVPHTTKFASVRGGNVWGSRGSVVERWTNGNVIEISDPSVTRFHLPMKYWLDFCYKVINHIHGGEVFIPKCKAWNLGTLASAFEEHFKKVILTSGARDGDKQHESLISFPELSRSVDIGWAYVIEPNKDIRDVWEYQRHEGKPVPYEIVSNRVYRMGIDELRTAIANGG